MKKLFLTLALAFVGIFTANAQVWIGGSLEGYANDDRSQVAVTPEIGYSFSDSRWTIATGARVELDIYNNDVQSTMFALSPYVRYALMNVEKFSTFMDLTCDLGLKGYKDGDEFPFRIALQPGVAFNPTKHWTAAFRFGLIGYDHTGCFTDYGKDKHDENKVQARGFVLGFAAAAPSFGLYYNF